MKAYLSGVSTPAILPIPVVSIASEEPGSTHLILSSDYAGLDAEVRYKKGSEPADTDTLFPSDGLDITEDGTYYFRAFSTDSAHIDSPSLMMDISIMELPQLDAPQITQSVMDEGALITISNWYDYPSGTFVYTTAGNMLNSNNYIIFDDDFTADTMEVTITVNCEGYLSASTTVTVNKPVREKLPTPVISQAYAGADAAGVITNIAILDNRSDYPDESIIHIRYIEAGITDWLEDPISNMDDTGMIYFLPESAGQMEVYISCTGYQDSDVASIEYEDVRPTPQLYDKLSDGSVICYDRGASYGEYLIINGDIIKQDSGSNWRYMICEGNDLNHYETNLGTDYESNGSYSGKKWGFSGTTTGINDTAIGSGKDNTDSLINENNNKDDSIWYYVNQHRTNTGKPWHVPSKDELNILYENLSHIGNFHISGMHFSYWSSSEQNSSEAWLQHFSNGSQTYNLKNLVSCRVRCVRYI